MTTLQDLAGAYQAPGLNDVATTLAQRLALVSGQQQPPLDSQDPQGFQGAPQAPASPGLGGLLQLLQMQQGGGGSPGNGGGSPSGVGGSPSHWEQVAQQMAARRGWTGPQWNAIDQIVTAESGWRPGAVNPSSGAYGIPQILPSAHPDTNLQGDPRGQIAWLMRYLQQRYGGPAQALDFRRQHGWY